MKILLGLVGEKGSGKGTFAALLRQRLTDASLEVFRFSDILFETLNMWHIPTTRENLQKLAVIMESFGSGTLSRAIKERVAKSTADIVVLDGIRWESDEAVLRNYPNNHLMYIRADASIRFSRLVARKEKSGEGETTWKQFLKEEHASNEITIPQIGLRADTAVIHNGDMKNLDLQVEKFYLEHVAALV